MRVDMRPRPSDAPTQDIDIADNGAQVAAAGAVAGAAPITTSSSNDENTTSDYGQGHNLRPSTRRPTSHDTSNKDNSSINNNSINNSINSKSVSKSVSSSTTPFPTFSPIAAHNSNLGPLPRLVDPESDDGGGRSFTTAKSTAKYAGSRSSDGLDRNRRKVERAPKGPHLPIDEHNDAHSRRGLESGGDMPAQHSSARSPFPAGRWPEMREKDASSSRDASRRQAAAGKMDGALAAGSQHGSGRLRRGPWRASLLTLLTTALSLAMVYVIVSSFFSRQLDPKGCRQCYMYPGYVRLADFDTEHTRLASKYSLWLYREGQERDDVKVCATS